MSRKIGIEIELGGLDEGQLSRLAAEVLGGTASPDGAQGFKVSGTEIGDLEVYLDMSFRHKMTGKLAELGFDAARLVVPVEIVTEPLTDDQIDRLDQLCDHARKAGATGTRDGVLLGFGVHLNVETTGKSLNDILPTLQAYALLEDLLRKRDPIDPSRRLLPFVDPYPRGLIDDLARQDFADMTALITCYLTHTPTRNRGLDMLPIFADIDRPLVEQLLDRDQKLSPRPAYHFRLPDCRIDDPAWSIRRECDRWGALEAVAANGDCLRDLCAGWRAHRDAWTTIRSDWADSAAAILKDHAQPEPVL